MLKRLGILALIAALAVMLSTENSLEGVLKKVVGTVTNSITTLTEFYHGVLGDKADDLKELDKKMNANNKKMIDGTINMIHGGEDAEGETNIDFIPGNIEE